MPDWPGRGWSWIWFFETLAARDMLSGRRLGAALIGLAALVTVIGGIDAVTGSRLSFGVFYLVPVALAVSFTGPRWALAVAGLSAVVWVLADRRIEADESPLALDAVNVGLRFSILAFVVGLLAALRHAMRRSQDSDRRSREFLAFLAHQLRTPVTSIGATAQGMLGQGGGTADEEALVRLAAESSRLGRLVSSSLRFLRLEQGDPMPRQSIDLRPLCREEVERHASLAAPTMIRFDGGPPADGAVPLVVDASPEALREALGNVLENAGRHAQSEVVVGVRASGRTVEVSVTDDGPGLPPGQEDRAFEPYITLDGRGGSGLGLAIARRLVASQGGSLDYRGGTFVLTLPRHR